MRNAASQSCSCALLLLLLLLLLRGPELREGSLLLRVEVVAQVLESTAGEMLSAAG